MKREIIELREVVQKLVPLLTGKGLKVTQRGSQAYVRTDPETRKPICVNIPNIGDNASDSFIRAVSGFIDHEVAHVLITDWNFYAGGPTAEDLKKPEVQKLANCHNIIEDTMIEREIVKIFPGSKGNIADLREHFIRKVTKPALANAKSPEEEFNYLLVPTMRALAGHVEFEEFMDEGDYWKHPMIENLVKTFDENTLGNLKKTETTEQTLTIARELYDILYKKKPDPENDSGGKSQDKPGKKADSGEGTGERDHSDSDGGESEDSSDTNEKGKGGKSDSSEPDGDEEEENDDAKAGGDTENTDDEEDAGDVGEPNSDGKDETDEDGDSDANTDGDDKDDGSGDVGDGKGGKSQPSTNNSTNTNNGVKEDTEISIKSDGGVDESESHAPKSNDDESQGGDGVGSEEGKAMFEFEDDALEGKGIAEEMMVLISEEAVEAISHSEWSVFSREWDRIQPIIPPDNINTKWIPEMEDEVRSMTGRMQKDIERAMASQSHVVNQPGHKKGRLHAASLYRVAQGDPRVFTQKQEHVSKETAVTLLIDNSGSMHGVKMRAAMLSAYALSSTLNRVGIAHEMIGFTTGNWDLPRALEKALQEEYDKSGLAYDRTIPLIMPIYKTFEERLDTTVKKRVAYAMNAQQGLLGNIDGECLIIAAERLARRVEKRKVMLVLSDGQPAGGTNSGSHLKGTVEYLNTAGIETIGIGIMSDAVKKYYENHVVLKDVNDLPGQVMTEIKRLLA